MAYKIQRGDTLSGIAQKYNTSVNELMSLNPYIKNANLIYAGNSLELPNQQPTTTSTVTNASTPSNNTNVSTPTTSAAPQKTTQELAEEYARNATVGIGNETGNLLSQYEKIAENQKKALEESKNQSINQISGQKDIINQNYMDNARQAYINKMLSSKAVEQEMAMRGLNTSGIVSDVYANVENSYGNNLANLQKNRDNSIKDIDTQINNINSEYAIKQYELLSEIENAKMDLQKYGNELAYSRYQDALNNYLNFANQDYTKEQARIAQENYLKELEYKKEQDRIAQENWLKEYELSLRQLANSSNRSSGSSRSSNYSSSNNWQITDNTGTDTTNVGNNASENTGTSNTNTSSNQSELDPRTVRMAETMLNNTSPNSLQRREYLRKMLIARQITPTEFNQLLSA